MLLLTVAQCIAPLVHAHSGGETHTFGLHLPGLEPAATNSAQRLAPTTAGHHAVTVEPGAPQRLFAAVDARPPDVPTPLPQPFVAYLLTAMLLLAATRAAALPPHPRARWPHHHHLHPELHPLSSRGPPHA